MTPELFITAGITAADLVSRTVLPVRAQEDILSRAVRQAAALRAYPGDAPSEGP